MSPEEAAKIAEAYTNGPEVNGLANIIGLLDVWPETGGQPELNEIRRQAMNTVEFIRAWAQNPHLKWHTFLKQKEAPNGR